MGKHTNGNGAGVFQISKLCSHRKAKAMPLTLAAAHVFRHPNGRHLDDLGYVALVTPDLRRSKPLDDACLAESGPAALRLRQVFEESNDAVHHFNIGIRLQQHGEIGGE